MIKIERNYTAEALFTPDQTNTWDKRRDKNWKLSFFGWQRWAGDEHKWAWIKDDVYKELKEVGFTVEEGFILPVINGSMCHAFTYHVRKPYNP